MITTDILLRWVRAIITLVLSSVLLATCVGVVYGMDGMRTLKPFWGGAITVICIWYSWRGVCLIVYGDDPFLWIQLNLLKLQRWWLLSRLKERQR